MQKNVYSPKVALHMSCSLSLTSIRSKYYFNFIMNRTSSGRELFDDRPSYISFLNSWKSAHRVMTYLPVVHVEWPLMKVVITITFCCNDLWTVSLWLWELLSPNCPTYATVLRLSVCTVAKRCVLEQNNYWQHIGSRICQNEWPWPLFRGRLKSCQPLCHVRYWISRKPIEIEAWFQRTPNGKWSTASRMVT